MKSSELNERFREELATDPRTSTVDIGIGAGGLMLLVASIFIVTLAGIVRGITGFGGALFMVPVLNLIVEPIEAVLYAFTPEALAIVVMLPKIWNKLDWCVLCAICFPALLTVPFGSMLLVWLDPHSLRTIISSVVIMFSLLMLTGLCYEGRPRIVTSACMGGIGGFMCGSTAMGGPPVILYLLSGTASAATTRGNLAAYVSVVSLCALIFPFLNGLITASVVQTSALQAPPYLLGTVLGGRAFARLDELAFRRVTLCLLICAGCFGLLR